MSSYAQGASLHTVRDRWQAVAWVEEIEDDDGTPTEREAWLACDKGLKAMAAECLREAAECRRKAVLRGVA